MASCARRLGLKPYEHGAKSASKIGSSTSFQDAWTTRSHGWNTQTASLTRSRLQDHPFPVRQRMEAAGFQLLPQLDKESLLADPFPDEGGGHPVDSGRACALVPRNPFPGHQQKPEIGDEVVRSDRSAVPAFLLVRFCGPPPEPDVPVGQASGSPQAR